MAVKTYFCKLIAPRPTFTLDMNDAERKIMQDHAVYIRGHMNEGKVVAYGLVADPAGGYGIAIVEVEDEVAARQLMDNDPSIRSGRGFSYELHPMPLGAVYPPRSDS